MERPRVCGYDCYTGEHIDREMTDEEYAQWLEDCANAPAPLGAENDNIEPV